MGLIGTVTYIISFSYLNFLICILLSPSFRMNVTSESPFLIQIWEREWELTPGTREGVREGKPQRGVMVKWHASRVLWILSMVNQGLDSNLGIPERRPKTWNYSNLYWKVLFLRCLQISVSLAFSLGELRKGKIHGYHWTSSMLLALTDLYGPVFIGAFNCPRHFTQEWLESNYIPTNPSIGLVKCEGDSNSALPTDPSSFQWN